jgi:proline dehydrogenase
MAVLEKPLLWALPHVPTTLMRRLALRYIAGETLLEALQRLRELADAGHPGILDILGEDVFSEPVARAVAAEYAQASRALAARGLDVYVSVKPTHVGLRCSERLALDLYGSLAAACRELGLFLRVEMEDHTTTDATLRVFRALRRDFANVGIVLQARLLRTPSDIRALLADGAGGGHRLCVRMVKGIYLEPEVIAHVDSEPIRRAYIECSRMLLAGGARLSFATHDAALGDELVPLAEGLGVRRDDFEFQVLLGVQQPLWERWTTAGLTVRVYVPYGPEWRPYTLRRMRQNPQLLRQVTLNALGLGSRP